MIHGPGVQIKYSAILEARRTEIFAVKNEDESVKLAKLLAFQDELRNGTIEQFNEWYEIYKDTIITKPKRDTK